MFEQGLDFTWFIDNFIINILIFQWLNDEVMNILLKCFSKQDTPGNTEPILTKVSA